MESKQAEQNGGLNSLWCALLIKLLVLSWDIACQNTSSTIYLSAVDENCSIAICV